jgi:hypothetical protein
MGSLPRSKGVLGDFSHSKRSLLFPDALLRFANAALVSICLLCHVLAQPKQGVPARF